MSICMQNKACVDKSKVQNGCPAEADRGVQGVRAGQRSPQGDAHAPTQAEGPPPCALALFGQLQWASCLEAEANVCWVATDAACGECP